MIRAALKNPYIVVVTALAISVLGAFSCTKIPADLLSQFNPHVQRAMMQQNVFIPAGSIKDGDQELQVFINTNVDIVDVLNDVPIKILMDNLSICVTLPTSKTRIKFSPTSFV